MQSQCVDKMKCGNWCFVYFFKQYVSINCTDFCSFDIYCIYNTKNRRSHIYRLRCKCAFFEKTPLKKRKERSFDLCKIFFVDYYLFFI